MIPEGLTHCEPWETPAQRGVATSVATQLGTRRKPSAPPRIELGHVGLGKDRRREMGANASDDLLGGQLCWLHLCSSASTWMQLIPERARLAKARRADVMVAKAADNVIPNGPIALDR
jgi:hypothetical protein